MRPTCPRCRRPLTVCYCDRLAPVPTRTRVVILQHPRERKVAIGTARMAHLALANSELLDGVDFSGHARLEAVAAEPDTYVLYPGEGAQDLSELAARPPRNIIVVDGTWPQAKKIIKSTPLLQRLPRVAFTPERPSNYRIREEPAFHCVSTVEAVVEVLAQLEGKREALSPLLEAFTRMVDMQLEAEARRTTPPRRKLKRPQRPPPLPRLLAERQESLVCLYAEANARMNGMGQPPELVQLVAARPFTGERLELFLAPRRPLWESVPAHLEVPRETLEGGLALEEGLARWRAFARPGDVVAIWGYFSLSLLTQEGVGVEEALDVREVVSRFLKRRPGALEDMVAVLGAAGPHVPSGQGRAGRRLAALEAVVRRLGEEATRLWQQHAGSGPRAATG